MLKIAGALNDKYATGYLYLIGEEGQSLSSTARDKKALDCFLSAQIPASLFYAGYLYREDRVEKNLIPKQRYVKALDYFLRSQSSGGFFAAAAILKQNLVDTDEKGKPLSPLERRQLAREYYLKAQTPNAYLEAGSLCEQDELYDEAIEYYRKSNLLEGKRQILQIYCKGLASKNLSKEEKDKKGFSYLRKVHKKLPEKESYRVLMASMLADRNFLLEGEPYERDRYAFELLKGCKDPEAKLLSGRLLKTGRVGHDLTEKARYQEAEKCFIESNNPMALFFLGSMYEYGQIGETLSIQEQIHKALWWSLFARQFFDLNRDIIFGY